jgi:hypothetical protein
MPAAFLAFLLLAVSVESRQVEPRRVLSFLAVVQAQPVRTP